MTIDSFCLNLIRNHYNSLDIDPSFRIGDEGELTLLRGDVMEAVSYTHRGDGRNGIRSGPGLRGAENGSI